MLVENAADVDKTLNRGDVYAADGGAVEDDGVEDWSRVGQVDIPTPWAWVVPRAILFGDLG